ncbi:TPA: deoxyribonuclease IV [candidate division WOR-3 bacterium]|jgi:deoxyribonuclease-4|uniref:Probable endonuclease 4 n=1 Tax=candidate division WOR-3 bacterium TaxID=2052148 RepID=A0A350HAQ1_UNCW3|nr:deoxyribonuclease IV [candidate division WOR-3 bacterium]
MPIFGAHLSISSGYDELFASADRIDCEAVQIFAKNQRQWESAPLAVSSTAVFKNSRKESNVKYMNVHSSYLLNLVTMNDEIYNKSISSLIDDMKRASILGIEDTVVHPGSHLGAGDTLGILRISEAINFIFSKEKQGNILLETTAGQGTSIGWKFDHLRDIISKVKQKDRIFVCYDTCHTFAAGYDIRTKSDYEKTMNEFDKIVGFSKLKLFHINDSKNEFNTRKDRHEFLGRGYIGIDAFGYLVNDSRFENTPMILEVPGEAEDFKKEIQNLKRLMKKK